MCLIENSTFAWAVSRVHSVIWRSPTRWLRAAGCVTCRGERSSVVAYATICPGQGPVKAACQSGPSAAGGQDRLDLRVGEDDRGRAHARAARFGDERRDVRRAHPNVTEARQVEPAG